MEQASTDTFTPTIAPPPRHLGEAEAASRARGSRAAMSYVGKDGKSPKGTGIAGHMRPAAGSSRPARRAEPQPAPPPGPVP